MLISIVAGSFNDNGGKPSGWAQKFFTEFNSIVSNNNGFIYQFLNGGDANLLEEVVNDYKTIKPDAIIWLADVPNNKPKLVKQIKEIAPHSLLVTSKRNLDNEYSLQDIISRALAIKSNLVIEFTGSRSSVESSVIDPLGNCFLSKSQDIAKVSSTIFNRLNTLNSVQRIGSKSIGEKIAVPESDDINSFMSIIKDQADTFHTIIHGVNTTRMLGNASFRCARGFPSFKYKDLIFVSQRNVDKRFISPEAFVATTLDEDNGEVNYYGDVKPSVDTPVQLRLYKYYKNINYMLHSHTYIGGAPYTNDVLPCGAVEECAQIIDAVKDPNIDNFHINIRGHGSIVLAKDLSFFDKVNWMSRPIPELA